MSTEALTLSADCVEAIALRVVQLLGGATSIRSTDTPQQKLTATELAKRLAVRRAWIYQHATELGAIRLGEGPRPRLRFDLALVNQRLATRDEGPRAAPERRSFAFRPRAAPSSKGAELLPIKGEVELSSQIAAQDRPGGACTPPAAAPKAGPPAR